MVGEVKGVDDVGVRVACRGTWSRGDQRGKIVVEPKRRNCRHDISDLALETLLLRPLKKATRLEKTES